MVWMISADRVKWLPTLFLPWVLQIIFFLAFDKSVSISWSIVSLLVLELLGLTKIIFLAYSVLLKYF